jgi:transcriptional regulator with XRE-family HTH domain
LVEKIKALCEQRGITIYRLEHDTGIGNGVIAKWKTCSPRVGTLKKVADYFGVSVDELLTDAPPDNPK